MRLLVLTVRYPSEVTYYTDWAEAFATHPALRATVHDIGTQRGKRRLPALVREADAIVALHATTSDWLADLEAVVSVLLDRRGPLIVFVGNEFNHPFPWLADKITLLRALEADLVVSQLLQETADWLYAEVGARVLSLPHGLNPRRFHPGPDHALRPLDLASRSFRYPVYVGDDERNRLFARACELAGRFAVDVRLDERLAPDAWAGLLRSAKATLSTEAGTAFLERDDHTARQVEALLQRAGCAGRRPPPLLRRWLRRMPPQVKAGVRRLGRRLSLHAEAPSALPAPVAQAIAAVFAQAAPSPVYGKCASPRHFEALGTRTLQLLAPGRYNDILKPGVHYLAVAGNGSDLREALELARDPALWRRITEAGYALGLESTYAARIDRLLAAL